MVERQDMDFETLLQMPPWEWPPDTPHKLLEVLRDSGEGDAQRLRAASMASDVAIMNEGIAQALLSILRDASASDDLRSESAIALGPVLELIDMDGFEDDDGDAPIGEQTFVELQESLQKIYMDADVPLRVRRRVLEASIRAPQGWHAGAIRAAFASGDEDWRLTAVFAMGWVRGFDEQILEALGTDNQEIHIEAVRAAGNRGIDSAWAHVASLLTSKGTNKGLLLAALDAAVAIRPKEVGPIVVALADDADEDIAAAAEEAMALADGVGGEEL